MFRAFAHSAVSEDPGKVLEITKDGHGRLISRKSLQVPIKVAPPLLVLVRVELPTFQSTGLRGCQLSWLPLMGGGGRLISRMLFSSLCGGWKAKVKVPAKLASGEALLPGSKMALLLSPHLAFSLYFWCLFLFLDQRFSTF